MAYYLFHEHVVTTITTASANRFTSASHNAGWRTEGPAVTKAAAVLTREPSLDPEAARTAADLVSLALSPQRGGAKAEAAASPPGGGAPQGSVGAGGGVPPGGDEKQEIDGNWGLSATSVVEVGDFDDEGAGGGGGCVDGVGLSQGGIFDEEAGVSKSGGGKQVSWSVSVRK